MTVAVAFLQPGWADWEAGAVPALLRRELKVQIEIANPLPDPTGQQPGNRMALDNIRERLMLFYDLEATLETQKGPDAYRVRIVLPFRAAAERPRP